MPRSLTYLFLFIVSSALGQDKHDLALVLAVQPEVTYHLNNYAYRWDDKFTTSTFNIGGSLTMQYNLTKRFYAEVGIGFISRKLNTIVFLNQAELPPPKQSFSEELVTAKSVAFETFELPFGIGYRLNTGKNVNFSFQAGATGHFLSSTCYKVVYFNKYEGSYQKNYWNGYALLLGIGAEIKIGKGIFFVSRIASTYRNTVTKDPYLFSQDEYEIALPHQYRNLTLGIKIVVNGDENK